MKFIRDIIGEKRQAHFEAGGIPSADIPMPDRPRTDSAQEEMPHRTAQDQQAERLDDILLGQVSAKAEDGFEQFDRKTDDLTESLTEGPTETADHDLMDDLNNLFSDTDYDDLQDDVTFADAAAMPATPAPAPAETCAAEEPQQDEAAPLADAPPACQPDDTAPASQPDTTTPRHMTGEHEVPQSQDRVEPPADDPAPLQLGAEYERTVTVSPEIPAQEASNETPPPAPASEAPTPAADPAPAVAVDVPQPTAGLGAGRRGRAKTRLLGFQPGNDIGRDVLSQAPVASHAEHAMFPVGWLVVISGAGYGASFTLHNGVCTIGRGADQSVRLDFGDNSISRENHASIAYDEQQRAFYIGHGGKANLVRRNDRPVLSTEDLCAGDKITIGETVLKFIPLCGQDFKWGTPDNNGWAHDTNG